MIPTLEPKAVAEALARGDQVFLLDVREPEEHERTALPNSVLIPLAELPSRLDELRELVAQQAPDLCVVYCRVGGRSEMAARWLFEHGFPGWNNLLGGTNQWSVDVDDSIEQY